MIKIKKYKPNEERFSAFSSCNNCGEKDDIYILEFNFPSKIQRIFLCKKCINELKELLKGVE